VTYHVIVTVVDDEAGSVHTYEGKYDDKPMVIAIENPQRIPHYKDVEALFDSDWNDMTGQGLRLHYEDPLKPGHIDYNQGA
jgi:hypothetical protein